MLQKHGARIGTQGDGFGCQQLLSHNRFGIAFHAVKIDPFVGGVFINEPYGALIVFGNDIGAQHLSGDAPGRFGRRFQLFLSSQRIGVRRVRVHSGCEGGRGGRGDGSRRAIRGIFRRRMGLRCERRNTRRCGRGRRDAFGGGLNRIGYRDRAAPF